jgi:O-antigen/teichoic acid export membrane protein
MIAYNLSIVLNVVLALFLIFRKGKYEVVQIKSRKILNKSLPMMISGFFIMLLSWTDILIMGKYETEENIGIYNAAFKVGTLALFVINATGVIILSDISKHYNDKNFLRLKKIINKTTQITILLTLPIVLFIFFFGKEMLSLFGNDFKKGYLALIIIATGAFFNSITGNVDQILNMTGNEQKVIRVMFVGFVLNILLNFMLIPNYGYVGAAFASFVVNIVVNTIFVIVIRKKLGFYTFI